MKLSDFDYLRSSQFVRFDQETVENHTFTIVSCIEDDPEIWQDLLVRECQGTTFDADGSLVCRPFEKFFYINEHKETEERRLRFLLLAAVQTKVDGSIVMPVAVNDKVYFKSKTSFYSDVAISATKNASQDLCDFCKKMISLGVTPIFEYVDPKHQVVLDYGEEIYYVLLALRYNETGGYVNFAEIETCFNVPIRDHNITQVYFDDSTGVNTDELMNVIVTEAKHGKGDEGWVLLFVDPDLDNKLTRVKVRTEWYKFGRAVVTGFMDDNTIE